MTINSVRKGKVAELEIANLLTKQTGHKWVRIGGIEKHKTVFTGDVKEVCPDSQCYYKRYFIDVKNRQGTYPKAISEWWQKVLDDSVGNDVPVLIYKTHSIWMYKDKEEIGFIRKWIKKIKDYAAAETESRNFDHNEPLGR